MNNFDKIDGHNPLQKYTKLTKFYMMQHCFSTYKVWKHQRIVALEIACNLGETICNFAASNYNQKTEFHLQISKIKYIYQKIYA